MLSLVGPLVFAVSAIPYLFTNALFSKLLKTRESWYWPGRFEYHKPYELNKIDDDFLIDFSLMPQDYSLVIRVFYM